jgi:hypothetical protein
MFDLRSVLSTSSAIPVSLEASPSVSAVSFRTSCMIPYAPRP